MTDIVSLRTLVLSVADADADLIRQGAGLTSLPIDFAHTQQATKAIALIGSGEVDLLLIDEAVAPASRDAVVAAAQKEPRPPATLVMVSKPPAPAFTDVLPDGLVTKPVTPDAATKMLNKCARLKLPSRVLIVDDSSTMRGIVRKILSGSRFPFDIAEAEEGVTALREIGSGKFDFVMLDYNMPGLNGIETLSEIKRVNPRVEVVMITATPDDEIAKKARAAGAAAFLKKPFYSVDIDVVLLRMCGARPLSR